MPGAGSISGSPISWIPEVFEDGPVPPKHCCPFWECEYVYLTNVSNGTAADSEQYDCGSGWTNGPGIGGALKRVIVDDYYRRWEYNGEDDIAPLSMSLVIECDRRPESIEAGISPCPRLSVYYDNGLADPDHVNVEFGPVVMDTRACDCLDDEVPDPERPGFSYGNAMLTQDGLDGIVQTGTCEFRLGDGYGLIAFCMCDTCNEDETCNGYPKQLHVVWTCAGTGAGTVECDLDFYPLGSLPPGATDPGLGLTNRGVWYGTTTVGACVFEFQMACRNVPPGTSPAGPLGLTFNLVSVTTGVGCTWPDTGVLDCNFGPLYFHEESSSCDPFVQEWEFCDGTPGGCLGYSTLTVTER